jgi:hypothetical protein
MVYEFGLSLGQISSQRYHTAVLPTFGDKSIIAQRERVLLLECTSQYFKLHVMQFKYVN